MSRDVNPRYVCQYCSKEILTQRLCSHILKYHYLEFYDTAKAQIHNPNNQRIIYCRDKKSYDNLYFSLGSYKNFKTPTMLESYWEKHPDEIENHRANCKRLIKKVEIERKIESAVFEPTPSSGPTPAPQKPDGWQQERDVLLAVIGSLTDELKIQKEFSSRFEKYWMSAKEEFDLTDDQYDDGDEYQPDDPDEYIGEEIDAPKFLKIKTKDCMKAYRDFHKNSKSYKKVE